MVLLAIYPRTYWGPSATPTSVVVGSMKRTPVFYLEARMSSVKTSSRPTSVRGKGRVILVQCAGRTRLVQTDARVTTVKAVMQP